MTSVFDWLKVQFHATLGSVGAPTERIFWVYLASALVIAFVVLVARSMLRGQGMPGSAQSSFGELFDPSVWLHRSAKTDYLYFLINRILFPLIFGWVGVIGVGIAASVYGLCLTLNGGETLGWTVTPGLLVGYTILVLVATDFGLYMSHTALHKVPLLWEFHKVHHSAQVLTPMTVYRQHPIDDFINISAGGIMSGLCAGLALFCVTDGFQPMQIAGLNGGIFLFYLLGYNLRHSHIWIAYPKGVSHFFVSPAQHQIHHSCLERHCDRNMGFMFACWDWMFGTLYVPQTQEEFPMGLSGEESDQYATVWQLYTVPFTKARKLLKRNKTPDTLPAE